MSVDPARVAASMRERFWLRVLVFAIKRANKAAGLHHGMTKYHWTRPVSYGRFADETYVEGHDAIGI